ncbi:MAG: PD-(D/E)XK nuclease family protein, partial [Planctomycetota bacterium]
SRRVVVLRGPAASGKTTAALGMYRRFVDTESRPHSLLIAPNSLAVRFLRHRLLEDSTTGVLLSPQVMTFEALGSRILGSAADRPGTLSAFQRRLLLRRIVDELARAGQFAAFSGVADTPGLIVTLDRAIAELKRAAVEPEALARTVGASGGKSRDLLEVYRRYQQAMVECGNYDVEGLMWRARESLTEKATDAALDSITSIAVDGFTDFTPTQLEILRLLSVRLERVLITIPHAADGRERMWRWTARTLDRIRGAFGDDLEEIEAAALAAPMRGLWDSVFSFDSGRLETPSDLHVIAAGGVEAEVATVARWVKRLFVSDADCGRIAVLARSMEIYRPAIERIFAAHDIPVASAPQDLVGVAIVRFVLGVAVLAPQFASHDVLRVIGNSYFRPQALGPYSAKEVNAVQMLIREGNVLSGRKSYSEAAQRLARRAATVGENGEELALGPLRGSGQLLTSASQMLQKLFDLAAGALDAAGILKLIDALELRQAALQAHNSELVARDLRALDALTAALGDPQVSGTSLSHLCEALGAIRLPPARGESLVEILGVLDARGVRYDHLFLLGLSEGEFPRRFVESSLIGEADRSAWRGRGLELDSRGDLTAREMLLFYLGLSRSARTLTLSFRDADATGRPASPSAFLLAAIAPMGNLKQLERDGHFERVPVGQFVPETQDIASPQDAFNSAIASLFDPQLPDSPGALAWAARNAPDKIRRAAAGLFAHYKRYLPGDCDCFDGRITDPTLLKRLKRRFGKETVFSATQLNTFGRCPWEFFAGYVLKLRPLSDPQRRLEPVDCGLFAHNVLFELMSLLREEHGESVRLSDIDEERLGATLADAVKNQSARFQRRLAPFPALWEVQKDRIHRQLQRYLLDQRSSSAEREHLYFELGFGVTTTDTEALDPMSRSDPVSIETPAGTVRIRGKIDRVDRVKLDKDEGLLVIDYKTGVLPTAGDITAGRSLQLPIYTEALEQIADAHALGGEFHQVFSNKKSHFSELKPSRDKSVTFDQRRGEAVAKIGEFVGGMEGGCFDLLPTQKCPRYC